MTSCAREYFSHCTSFTMFRQSIRRFGTTAIRAATEGASSYTSRVSTAQGVVHGLTEGMSSSDETHDPLTLTRFST